MFTLEEINAAHSKVKTGADFPAYIRALKGFGVTYYETFLVDVHTEYHGRGGFKLVSGPKYDAQDIAAVANAAQLRADISHHQAGGSDYFQITRQCAGNGIEKWAICMDAMTCTYYDKAGNEVMVETIPDVIEAPARL